MLTPGLGPRQTAALLRAFGLPEQVFDAPADQIRAHLGTTLTTALLARDDAREAAIVENLAWASTPGHHLVALGEPQYPAKLLDLADAPVLLWARGRLELLAQDAVAVVGSRQATRGGLRHAHEFARALGDAGLVVVSGLAMGIDAAAHLGGLQSASSSIAVVGHGLDSVYPRSHRALCETLAERGLVLSEFPVGAPPLPDHFPRRNRIIAALGLGVLVVEAARGSGSLITSRLALEIGREVFAIPGSIDSAFSKGCHLLIKQGAKLVEESHDVLDELRRTPAYPVRAATSGQHAPEDHVRVDAVARRMLARLGWDPVAIDELSRSLDMDVSQVQSRVALLELAGQIERFADGRVKRLS